ncbi:MAG: ABC transporter ATP-binding protein [Candidatus Pacebacteria bacterium]|nr:ABC transporter ATP-binding protein [Candidatus Paceibacterota bacterium]
MKQPIIKLEDVFKIYKHGDVETAVLQGVNLDVFENTITSIIGPSGSGKSTLLNILGLLDVPDKGKMFLEGQDTSKLSFDDLADIRGKRIGFVFQQFNLVQHLSALENITMPMIFQKKNEGEAIEKGRQLLELVNLRGKENSRPGQLSGGEQQRVAIARALANDPEIILADEPTGNLDSRNGQAIMELLANLNKKEQKTVVVITHDSNIAAYCDSTIIIKDGKIVK